MMCNEIPAGYQLHIKTWENDADHYLTQVISGLTEEDVKFHLFIVSHFYSRNGFSFKRGLGNGSIPEGTLIELIQSALTKFPNISDSTRDMWNCERSDDDDDDDDELLEEFELVECYYESLVELLGYPVNDSYVDLGLFCRVFDSYHVYYIEKPIHDVTKQFPV